MRQVFGTMPAGPGGPFPPSIMNWMLLAGIVVQLAIAWAYPVAVLVVMHTKTARR